MTAQQQADAELNAALGEYLAQLGQLPDYLKAGILHAYTTAASEAYRNEPNPVEPGEPVPVFLLESFLQAFAKAYKAGWSIGVNLRRFKPGHVPLVKRTGNKVVDDYVFNQCLPWAREKQQEIKAAQ